MKNSKFKIQNFSRQLFESRRDPAKAGKFLIVVLIFAFCIFNSWGCATVIEGSKKFAGISTQELEQGRKNAITKTFNYDYFTCYTKTWDILKDMRNYVYMQSIKKHMIAVYISRGDTTPVGFFFKEVDADHTEVQVSSPSTYAKERLSKKLFSALEGLSDPKKEAVETDEQEE